METYKWQLSRVADTHGNLINYSYDRANGQRTACSNRLLGMVDWDVWPTAITWGGNAGTGAPDRYKVEFQSTAREYDTDYDQPDNQFGPGPHETRKLNAVRALSNPSLPYNSTDWELVRQYNFSYD